MKALMVMQMQMNVEVVLISSQMVSSARYK